MDKLNGCIFLLKMMTYQNYVILFGDKDSADIRKEFDREPVYNKNYLKTKVSLESNPSYTLIILV